MCTESCYISSHLPVPSRNQDYSSLYFTADLKYGTMTTMMTTNMSTG